MTTIACTLTDQDHAENRGRWHELAARTLVAVTSTPRGLRLEFHAGPDVRSELADLVALERECCAFASWTLSEAGGRVVLDVTGRTDEAVLAVQAMFSSLR